MGSEEVWEGEGQGARSFRPDSRSEFRLDSTGVKKKRGCRVGAPGRIPPSRPGGSLRRPGLITVYCGTAAGRQSSDKLRGAGRPAKEGSQMLVAFLLLAGLLLWATGHMILR